MCTSQLLLAQNSHLYKHDPAVTFGMKDNVVHQKFESTATYLEGTIIFQPVKSSILVHLQVTLIDLNGNVQLNNAYQIVNWAVDLVPIASAYNNVTKEYIVTGVCDNGTGGVYGTWYIVFDQDLNATSIDFFQLQTSNPHAVPQTFGANTSTFVTDVCAVIDPNSLLLNQHFAFTGLLLEEGNNPYPRPDFATQPTRRTLFVAVLDATNKSIQIAHDYFFDNINNDATKYTFPSRIVEVYNAPGGNNYAGYIVGGTTANANTDDAKRFFYLRVTSDLTLLDHKVVDDINHDPDLVFAVGDMHHIPYPFEVQVAGTITNINAGTHGYFFDKLHINTNPTSVNSWLDQWPSVGGIQQMGIMWMNQNRLGGFPKVGRIGVRNDVQGRSGITGSFCRNTFYQNAINNLYSSLLPNLFEVDYSNVGLDNWTSMQIGLFDLYPRQHGILGPIWYYQGMSFEHPWYPNHKSYQHNETTNLFELGQIGLENITGPQIDYSVVNYTFRPYQNNNCQHDEDNATLDMMEVDIQQFTVFDAAMTSQDEHPDMVMPNLQIPDHIDCQIAPFRPIFDNTNYTIVKNNTGYEFNGFDKKYNLILYNAMGAVLIAYKDVSAQLINMDNKASGVYILKVVDNNSLNSETIKLTK